MSTEALVDFTLHVRRARCISAVIERFAYWLWDLEKTVPHVLNKEIACDCAIDNSYWHWHWHWHWQTVFQHKNESYFGHTVHLAVLCCSVLATREIGDSSVVNSINAQVPNAKCSNTKCSSAQMLKCGNTKYTNAKCQMLKHQMPNATSTDEEAFAFAIALA